MAYMLFDQRVPVEGEKLMETTGWIRRNLLIYWLRVPFSSSTGAAKAHVMKNAMIPECLILNLRTGHHPLYRISRVHLKGACQQGVLRSQRGTLLNAPDFVV